MQNDFKYDTLYLINNDKKLKHLFKGVFIA